MFQPISIDWLFLSVEDKLGPSERPSMLLHSTTGRLPRTSGLGRRQCVAHNSTGSITASDLYLIDISRIEALLVPYDNTCDHVCEEPSECTLNRHPRYLKLFPDILHCRGVACRKAMLHKVLRLRSVQVLTSAVPLQFVISSGKNQRSKVLPQNCFCPIVC